MLLSDLNLHLLRCTLCLASRCCHYGGGDPFEAEEVVREMCAMTDTEPDAVMVQLLATIDLTWQQLHCGI